MVVTRPTEDISYKWRSLATIENLHEIEDLNSKYSFADIDSLQQEWLHLKSSVERSDPEAYKGFKERLTRNMAIYTGIIENVYTIEKGVTQTLIEKGLDVSVIDPDSTNMKPDELIAILQDHQNAIEGVHLQIANRRPLAGC